jgi:hypothetical protein
MRKALFIISVFVIAFAFSSKAFALTVSPAKIEVRANPGQQARGEIEVFNEQADTKTFYTSFENFESRGDTGAPYFTGAESGLAKWITTDKEVKLNNGERLKIPFVIDIPSDTKPGGYFSAIFFGTEKPKGENGGEVSIGGKIGVLIMLRVNGEIIESAGLSSFNSEGSKRLYASKPINLEYNFNNVGGDRVVPKGEIVIRNTLRMKTETLLANEKEGSVLPQSTRRFSAVWGTTDKNIDKSFFTVVKKEFKEFNFGWYTATLNLTWGESSQIASETYNFFIFPWHLVLVVIVGVFVLKIILSFYKKQIIREASNAKKN